MKNNLENLAIKITKWVGSVWSLIAHTIIFTFIFILPTFGIPLETVMLVFTSLVSMEAIYLSIFIQMSVNRNTESISHIEENVAEVQEDIDEIAEGVEGIEKDIDELQEDVEDIAGEVMEEGK